MSPFACHGVGALQAYLRRKSGNGVGHLHFVKANPRLGKKGPLLALPPFPQHTS